MLIDSIMGTIDHIYCDNTFHVITEQNHRRNTIVRRMPELKEETSGFAAEKRQVGAELRRQHSSQQYCSS